MTYKESVNYLKALNPMGIRLGLDQINSLLDRIGNPHLAFPSVIVAGTNGKGSVASMTASILSAAGYKTGLYTSPDLVDFRERIRVNGEMISEQDTVVCVESVKKMVTETVSYFEFITAMAFLFFQTQKVDIAILEVGLGGRLDATNVVTPLVSIITNISLEHQDYLGNTLSKIASEKAGVIKDHGICITAARQAKVVAELDSICKARNAKLLLLGKDFKTRSNPDGTFSYTGIKKNYKKLYCPFTGAHQIANAALALGVLEIVETTTERFNVPVEAVVKGLAEAKWEGRLEVLDHSPLFLVDGAHNPSGVSTLCHSLSEDFSFSNLVLIFGVMGDKNYRMMARMLFPLAHVVILTRPPSERSLPPDELALIAASFNSNIQVIENPEEALGYARSIACRDDLICAAGSLYLVGEIKRIYRKS